MDADYVIVGTGSAGAVLANRLSADPAVKVVVLEAGARDKDKFVHIPAGFAQLMRGPLDWDYLPSLSRPSAVAGSTGHAARCSAAPPR